MYKRGDVVLCRWGYNDILNRPFEFLFEYGYKGATGKHIVYKRGEHSLQDAMAFSDDQIRHATAKDRDQRFFYR